MLQVLACECHFKQGLASLAVASSVSHTIDLPCKQSYIFHSHTFLLSGSACWPPRHCSGAAPLGEPERRGLVRVAGCLHFRVCDYKHGRCSRLAWSCVANILQLESRFGSCTCVCFAMLLFARISISFPPGMNSSSSSLLIADGSLTLRIALAAAAFIPVSTCGVFIFPVVRVIVSSLTARVSIWCMRQLCHTQSVSSFLLHDLHMLSRDSLLSPPSTPGFGSIRSILKVRTFSGGCIVLRYVGVHTFK